MTTRNDETNDSSLHVNAGHLPRKLSSIIFKQTNDCVERRVTWADLEVALPNVTERSLRLPQKPFRIWVSRGGNTYRLKDFIEKSLFEIITFEESVDKSSPLIIEHILYLVLKISTLY